jgi:ABC-type uncharacterized transport system involved in gliding motility auxiliary subunit
MKPIFKKLSTELVVAVVILIAASVIASRWFFRADLTDDDIYTLSEGSKAIAQKVEDKLDIKLYFSESAPDLPPSFKAYGSRVEEVLREYASYANGNITVEHIDPKPDSDEEVWARKYGIQGISTPSGYDAYLGVVMLSGSKESAIAYLDPRREEFLEYDISEQIFKLGNRKKPKLQIYSSLPVSMPAQNPNMGVREWAYVTGLRNSFNVDVIRQQPNKIADDVDIFILMHPKMLNETFEYALDQYVLRGGRLIVMVDPFSRTDLAMTSGNRQNSQQIPDSGSNLKRLFDSWGLTFSADNIVGDPLRATRINAASRTIDYPYFLSLTPEDITNDQLITGQLKQMLFPEPGYFTFNEANADLKFTPLVQTSENAAFANKSLASFLSPLDFAAQLGKEKEKRVIAGMIQGKFNSAFEKAPEGAESSGDFKKVSVKDSAVLVIGDIDFIFDDNAVERMRFINQVIMRPRNDNLNLVLNATEFLGGSPDLISIRTSGRVQRPFTKVTELQIAAQDRWKAEEERLSGQLRSLQQKLGELQSKRTDGNQAILNADQEQEIKKFREEEAQIRTKRREVRKNLREDIEALGRRLIALNLLFIPGLVSGLGFFVFWKREQRAKKGE